MNEKLDGPLRKWRNDARLNLEQVCDRFAELGFERPSTAKLSRIETGEQNAPLAMIPQFEVITGLAAKDLFPEIAKIFEPKEVA
jgi:transcriptional regulator with XRE-family HTH domain